MMGERTGRGAERLKVKKTEGDGGKIHSLIVKCTVWTDRKNEVKKLLTIYNPVQCSAWHVRVASF